ncbi:MAG: glycosyl hydrolase [Bacteroidetes bacterium]|nr:glycosyl hydrolase [Bacteroidota bacterium]
MNRFTSLLLATALLFTTQVFAQKKKAEEPKKEDPKHYLDTLGLGLTWRSVGPAITSGRISDFAVDPQHRSNYYVASSAGGVWKTTNAGSTFEPIFDGEGSFSIGCITLDPSNVNTVWVGTGENNNQRSVNYGDGVYKSNDGGKSWSNMGLKNSEHIGKILVDPRNSDVVYVAAIGPLWSAGGDRGVYKTTDGGKTWTMVLNGADGKSLIDENTGVNDLVIDPRNPDVLYASAFQRRRHVFTYVGGGPGSTVYKSVDGGKTWAKTANGLPGVDLGRIQFAFSSDPEILYATVEAAEGKGGFFKTSDRGASWEKQSSPNLSGNYFGEIFTNPTDPNTIYLMDVFNKVSHDGGKSWENLGEEFKHVDNHVLWVDPKDPDYMLAGCDGGVYESFDGAKSWKFMANLPVTQFYKVAVDNSMPFYQIHGGTQDNFSMGGPSRTRNGHGIANYDWYMTSLGDGFESQIDPENPNIVYAQSQYGGLVRYDRISGESTTLQPKPLEGEDALRWNWDAPLAVSNHKASRLYFCANRVFKTEDRGDTWTAISPDLSRQIDRNTLPVMGRVQSMDAVAKNASTSEYGAIVAFSESPKNPNLLYVGTDDGLVQITENGGQTWTKISSFPGVPDMTYVNALYASQHDENVVYAAFNNHKRGDFKPYVFKSTDKGRTWTNISNNLPERGSAYAFEEDHVDKNLLFVGTEFGCFFSNDGGKFWKQLGGGLPAATLVRDIAIQRRENDLVIATFGRGFYVLDDYSPLRNLTDLPSKEATILPIKDGLVFNVATPIGYATGKGFQGASFYTAPNPPMGTVFTYFVKDEVKTLKQQRQDREKKLIKDGKDVRYPTYDELKAEQEEEAPYLLFTVRNNSGNIMRQIKSGWKKGVNRIVWDGRVPSPAPVNLGGGEKLPWESPDGGHMALPGEYTVSLTKVINGVATEMVAPQKFKLNTLGGSTLPATDKAALDAYVKEAAELERAWNGATGLLGESNNVVKYMRQATYSISQPAPQLLADVKALEQKIKELYKAFYGDGVATKIDKSHAPSLSDRIYGMSYDIWSSSSAPTNTQREQMAIAGKLFKAELAKLKQLVEVDLPAMDKKLEVEKAPWTPGRLPIWNID